jgi:hypothetical protein
MNSVIANFTCIISGRFGTDVIHSFSKQGLMVDKLTHISLSTSRSFDLFFDLIVFAVEKAASHRIDVEKGSKISEALFTIAGYSFLREIQNVSREMS